LDAIQLDTGKSHTVTREAEVSTICVSDGLKRPPYPTRWRRCT